MGLGTEYTVTLLNISIKSSEQSNFPVYSSCLSVTAIFSKTFHWTLQYAFSRKLGQLRYLPFTHSFRTNAKMVFSCQVHVSRNYEKESKMMQVLETDCVEKSVSLMSDEEVETMGAEHAYNVKQGSKLITEEQSTKRDYNSRSSKSDYHRSYHYSFFSALSLPLQVLLSLHHRVLR